MINDVIFAPFKFRNLIIKNRIFCASISGRFDNEDGSLTQTRINWECKFAAGEVGAIISSDAAVLMEGRSIAGHATIHRDDFIPLWERLGRAVHQFDCKYILQLDHCGRQMHIPGVHNQRRRSLSSTPRCQGASVDCRGATSLQAEAPDARAPASAEPEDFRPTSRCCDDGLLHRRERPPAREVKGWHEGAA